MKNVKWLLIFLMLIFLFGLIPSAETLAETREIPLDANNGATPQDSGYLSDCEYEDPSIHVEIGEGRIYDTNYVYAKIKIANASQIRTAMEKRFNSTAKSLAVQMAKHHKAVIAVNGDFFNESDFKIGYFVRQGVEYKRDIRPFKNTGIYHDILLIDDHGDFHILKNCTNEVLDECQVAGIAIINSFTFGPGLVIDGEVQTGFPDMNNSAPRPARRTCIAQTGPLEYLIIASEGPNDKGSVGLNLEQFAELVSSFEHVKNAYNLDGGTSATLAFQRRNEKGRLEYKKINALSNLKTRSVRDILYFASAYYTEE